MMPRYLIEIETKTHTFQMTVQEAKSSGIARASAKSRHNALGASLVACSKDAPEMGDTCHRELVE